MHRPFKKLALLVIIVTCDLFSQDLFPIIEKKWTYVDSSMKQVFQKDFYYAGDFKNNYAVVFPISHDSLSRDIDFLNVIDTNGQLQFDKNFHDCGYASEKGLITVDSSYEVYVSSDMTDSRSKWGVYDLRSRSWLVHPKYDFVFPYDGVVTWANLGGEYSFPIRLAGVQNGKPASISYSLRTFANQRIIPVVTGGKWHLIDEKGRVINKRKYKSVRPFVEGYSATRDGDKWGFNNEQGDISIEHIYNDVRDFKNGYAGVQTKGKWGFISRNGQEAIQATYDMVRDFNYGLAPVKVLGKWIFIDTTGKKMVPGSYDDAMPFVYNLAPVKIGSKWGITNFEGEMVVEPFYDAIKILTDSIYAGNVGGLVDSVSNEVDGGEWHIKKLSGAWLISRSVNKCEVTGHFIRVWLRKTDSNHIISVGYIDKLGKIVWKPR